MKGLPKRRENLRLGFGKGQCLFSVFGLSLARLWYLSLGSSGLATRAPTGPKTFTGETNRPTRQVAFASDKNPLPPGSRVNCPKREIARLDLASAARRARRRKARPFAPIPISDVTRFRWTLSSDLRCSPSCRALRDMADRTQASLVGANVRPEPSGRFTMQASDLVSALEALAARLGVPVRYDVFDRGLSKCRICGVLCRRAASRSSFSTPIMDRASTWPPLAQAFGGSISTLFTCRPRASDDPQHGKALVLAPRPLARSNRGHAP